MSKLDHWSAELSIDEHDGETHAEARLVTTGDLRLSGRGSARRNPADQDITEIGEQIAVARALSDLAHKLLATAAAQIEAVTHERARLHM